MDGPCRLRPASRADVAAIARLELRAFSDAWTEAQLTDALKAPGAIGLVAEEDDDIIVGHLIGRSVVDEGEILTVAVDPDRRRRGIGQQLLLAAMAQLQARGVGRLWLEVRASNAGAQALYAGQGFIPAGRRRSYYRDPVEDALVLRRDLPPVASTGPPER
jgi:ribosomal-protein-alanine N-acetyltransferase